eukprot:m.139065 g.139065  ORF g.139065 m.139065 type:complete len:277 (+) comp38265_c1_seq1:1651-2481(+)
MAFLVRGLPFQPYDDCRNSETHDWWRVAGLNVDVELARQSNYSLKAVEDICNQPDLFKADPFLSRTLVSLMALHTLEPVLKRFPFLSDALEAVTKRLQEERHLHLIDVCMLLKVFDATRMSDTAKSSERIKTSFSAIGDIFTFLTKLENMDNGVQTTVEILVEYAVRLSLLARSGFRKGDQFDQLPSVVDGSIELFLEKHVSSWIEHTTTNFSEIKKQFNIFVNILGAVSVISKLDFDVSPLTKVKDMAFHLLQKASLSVVLKLFAGSLNFGFKQN